MRKVPSPPKPPSRYSRLRRRYCTTLGSSNRSFVPTAIAILSDGSSVCLLEFETFSRKDMTDPSNSAHSSPHAYQKAASSVVCAPPLHTQPRNLRGDYLKDLERINHCTDFSLTVRTRKVGIRDTFRKNIHHQTNNIERASQAACLNHDENDQHAANVKLALNSS